MKQWRHLAGTTVLAVMLGACASDDPGAPTGDEAAASAEPDGDAVEAPDGTEAGTLEVVAVDYAFEGLPDEIDVGAQLTLRNDAESELHELVAFRLPDDETRSIDEIMQLPPEQMQAALGPAPTTVLLTAPGSDQIAAIGDGTLEEAGRYAIVCMIPTGADAAEYLEAAATSDGPPEVDGGPPHIVHGMFAEVDVR